MIPRDYFEKEVGQDSMTREGVEASLPVAALLKLEGVSAVRKRVTKGTVVFFFFKVMRGGVERTIGVKGILAAQYWAVSQLLPALARRLRVSRRDSYIGNREIYLLGWECK
jgi:hypothetical protein